jgi:hypothetical protein
MNVSRIARMGRKGAILQALQEMADTTTAKK